MNTVKPDLREMRRLLQGHQWSDLAEWCDAIRALADLSNAQIDLLVTPDGSNGDAALNGGRITGNEAVATPGVGPDADSADCAGERLL